MKNLVCICLVLIAGITSVQAQSSADTLQIRKACLDYVEGFFTQDSIRLKNAMHPELVKRIVGDRKADNKLFTIGVKELVSYLKPENKIKNNNPKEPFQAEIIIYDISMDIAIAKIATNKMPEFFDYVQLGKVKDEWKIINVLWALNK
ncbi:MAG: nuclear transport factor 2 family protein [Cyclobacteriaceae bacterium]|nr:nuclear transport factor 2 family protein [Cyclobacteriaceae bacterium]